MLFRKDNLKKINKLDLKQKAKTKKEKNCLREFR